MSASKPGLLQRIDYAYGKVLPAVNEKARLRDEYLRRYGPRPED